MKFNVFISYRRKGALDLAGRIRDNLKHAGFEPFLDVESMRSGRYDIQLNDRIDECEHFLLVLPPKGLNRCKNEDDWVRKELEHALLKEKHIIPVLMPGFDFPNKMPPSIDGIRFAQAITPSPDSFEFTMSKIIDYLNEPTWTPINYDINLVREKNRQAKNKRIAFKLGVSVLSAVLVLLACLIQPWTYLWPKSDAGNQSSVSSEVTESQSVASDSTIPTIILSKPMIVDGNIIFYIHFDDESNIGEITLSKDDIYTYGFVGNIAINGDGKNVREIVISNYTLLDSSCKLGISEGIVTDKSGNKSRYIESRAFDFTVPTMTISTPSAKEVNAGGSISYSVSVNDIAGIRDFSILKNTIILTGFTAEMEITQNSLNVIQITFSNIQKSEDSTTNNCYFTLLEGVAVNNAGKKSLEHRSPLFTIID